MEKVIDVEATATNTVKPEPKLGEALMNLGGLIWSLALYLLMYPVRRVQKVVGANTMTAKALKVAAVWVAIVTIIGVFSSGDRGDAVRYNSAVALAAAYEGEFSQMGEYAWKTISLQEKPGVFTRAANALF